MEGLRLEGERTQRTPSLFISAFATYAIVLALAVIGLLELYNKITVGTVARGWVVQVETDPDGLRGCWCATE